VADIPAPVSAPPSLGLGDKLTRAADIAREQTYLFSLLLAIALIIANYAVLPPFLSTSQLPLELGTLAPFALAAMASTPAILAGGGGIDLSIAPLMGLVNVVLVVGLLPNGMGSPEVAIPLMLILGGVVGAINGVLVGVLRYPPVIATLGVYFILGGVDLQLAPNPVSSYPGWTVNLANTLAGIPGAIFTVGVVLALWFFFRRTAYYRHLFAVGDDDVAAYSSGVNVTMVRILAYTMGGVLAAVGGIALTGQIQSADVTVWQSFVLIALAAVALGGTKLSGGRGGFLGSALGALCVYLINALLSALGVDVFYIPVAYGAVLLVAVVAGSSLGKTSTRWTRSGT
jgi:ribose transport system permease protein